MLGFRADILKGEMNVGSLRSFFDDMKHPGTDELQNSIQSVLDFSN